MTDYTIDPSTGLPQLPEDYVFTVQSMGTGKLSWNSVEIPETTGKPIYCVTITKLEAEEVLPDKPIFVDKWFGLVKTFSHYEKVSSPPRKPRHYSEATAYLVEEYSADNLPDDASEVAKKDVENWKASILNLRPDQRRWERLDIYRILDLNDENILATAVKVYVDWKKWEDEQEKARLKRVAQKTLEDKYLGSYPPKGINLNE